MSPDGSTKPPPEEKLLHLIRGKGPRAAGGSHPARSSTEGGPTVVVLSGLRTAGRELGWLKIASSALAIVVVCEGIAFIMQATRPLPVINLPEVASSSSEETPESTSPSTTTSQDVPSLDASVSRPLFTPPPEVAPVVPTTTPPKPTGPSPSAKLLASRLSLMGIIAGTPGQAIIEDEQTKKTYFVTEGQVVVEGAILEKVLENRVLLNVDGENIELTL